MKTSERGKELIKSFESMKLKPYKLAGEQYYTVGFGHYGADVNPNKKYTKKQVETFFESDLEKFETNVNRYDKLYRWNQNEFDAMVSFAFDVGSIDGLTAKGSRSREAIVYFMRKYVKGSDGATLQGLVNRREKEISLFCESVSCGFDEEEIIGKKGR